MLVYHVSAFSLKGRRADIWDLSFASVQKREVHASRSLQESPRSQFQ
jgi:hypothetical protein